MTPSWGKRQMIQRIVIMAFTTLLLTACELAPVKQVQQSDSLIELQNRADQAYWNEDWETAEQEYLTLTKQAPDDAESWFRLGNVYAQTERLEASVMAYREALARDDSNSKAWHNLGIVQLRQASTTFNDMIEHTNASDPLNQRARYMLDAITRAMAARFGVTVTE